MARSQRHAVYIKGVDASGKGVASGVAAPVYVQQFNASQSLTVPLGPPSGPLKGSSLAGFPPTALPGPKEGDPTGLSVRADEGELTDPGQFNLSGNPNYISLPPEGGSAPEPPDPALAPTLTSLDPNTAVLGSEDFTLRCLGTNFTEESIINFAGQPEPIVFVSPEEITTGVKPSLGWGTNVGIPVFVQNADGQIANPPLDFVFTDPVEGRSAGGRAFPLGPFNIVRVDDDADGLGLELVEGDIRAGDKVLIEATGSSSVNGSYTVLSVDNGVVVIDSDFAMTTPIEGKGRLTVTGGA